MSDARIPDQPNDSTAIKAARVAFKSGIVGAEVSFALFLPCLFMQSRQVVSSANFVNVFKIASFGTLSRSYVNAAKASTLKNGVYGQKDNVDDAFKTSTEEKMIRGLQVSLTLGVVDGLCTHPSKLKAAFFAAKCLNPEFIVPKPKTFSESISLNKIALGPRVLSSTFSVIGFFTSDQIAAMFAGSLPVYSGIDMSWVLGIGVSAVVVGGVTNALSVVGANQAFRVDPYTYTAPKFMTVARDLFEKEGPRVITRGFGTSTALSAAIYTLFPTVDKHAGQVVAMAEEKLRVLVSSLCSYASTEKARMFKTASEQTENTNKIPAHAAVSASPNLKK